MERSKNSTIAPDIPSDKKARVQKTRLVSLFEKLKAGPWEPGKGWDDKRFRKNCALLAMSGIATKNLALACVLVKFATKAAGEFYALETGARIAGSVMGVQRGAALSAVGGAMGDKVLGLSGQLQTAQAAESIPIIGGLVASFHGLNNTVKNLNSQLSAQESLERRSLSFAQLSHNPVRIARER
jgi:hypothetical protein